MTSMLQEFCDSRGVAVRVDRQRGVIRGVKVLGLESRNGRAYLPEALAAAAPLYEDAKVNVNHPKGGANAPRDYQDRIGTIRGVVVRPNEGLFGDFHFNPKHALAEQVMWDAEHAPENVGFSHNVEARVGRRGEQIVVEAITRVQSVDLVADPATTRGLFESTSTAKAAEPPTALTLADLRRDHPQLVEAIREEQTAEIRRLKEEIERLTVLDAAQRKRAAAQRLLREFHLPDLDATGPVAKAILSEQFIALLFAAADEQAMRGVVEERSRLVQAFGGDDALRNGGASKPLSRDQHSTYAGGLPNSKSFVEAIT